MVIAVDSLSFTAASSNDFDKHNNFIEKLQRPELFWVTRKIIKKTPPTTKHYCFILIWTYIPLRETKWGVVVVFWAPRGTWFPASSKNHLSAEKSCIASAGPQIQHLAMLLNESSRHKVLDLLYLQTFVAWSLHLDVSALFNIPLSSSEICQCNTK